MMNMTELQNVTTLQDWLKVPNMITGGTIAWSSVFIAFVLVLFLGLMRTGYDLKRSLVTSLFASSLLGLVFYGAGLIELKLVIVSIVLLAVSSIAFLKHE